MTPQSPDPTTLNTIFTDCRQCGACCKRYRRIRLEPEEVSFIKRMGGYVGINLNLNALRDHSLKELVDEANKRGETYMIHPDDKGCIFLEKRDGKHFCKIYHYRPRTCRGFRCNLADNSFLDVIGDDAIWLLNENRFGLRLE